MVFVFATGIIASKRCNNVKIYGNKVYNGDEAGIFLHRSSDDAEVYGGLVQTTSAVLASLVLFRSDLFSVDYGLGPVHYHNELMQYFSTYHNNAKSNIAPLLIQTC